jgi:hypothetical protein
VLTIDLHLFAHTNVFRDHLVEELLVFRGHLVEELLCVHISRRERSRQ